MINETIFLTILLALFVFLFLTFKYQNVACGAFTIILCLIIASQFLPSIGGIQYKSGANITTSGDDIFVVDNYATYDNIPVATVFFLMALYLSMQIITFHKEERKKMRGEE